MHSFNEHTSQAEVIDFRTGCWIDGEFIPAKSGKTFENINPATGQKLCYLAA